MVDHNFFSKFTFTFKILCFQIQGTPVLKPLTALQLQSQLAILLVDPTEGDITSNSLINTGTTNVPKYMK